MSVKADKTWITHHFDASKIIYEKIAEEGWSNSMDLLENKYLLIWKKRFVLQYLRWMLLVPEEMVHSAGVTKWLEQNLH